MLKICLFGSQQFVKTKLKRAEDRIALNSCRAAKRSTNTLRKVFKTVLAAGLTFLEGNSFHPDANALVWFWRWLWRFFFCFFFINVSFFSAFYHQQSLFVPARRSSPSLCLSVCLPSALSVNMSFVSRASRRMGAPLCRQGDNSVSVGVVFTWLDVTVSCSALPRCAVLDGTAGWGLRGSLNSASMTQAD